jgi:uncharacterized protein YjbJ (UPF0337 family)
LQLPIAHAKLCKRRPEAWLLRLIARCKASLVVVCNCSTWRNNFVSLTHFNAFEFFLLIGLPFTGEPSKVTGHKDEVIGSVKSSVGGLLHNNEMKAKGDAQHASGTTEVNAATAKQKADAAAEGGKGNIKSVIGSLTGNDKMVSFQALLVLRYAAFSQPLQLVQQAPLFSLHSVATSD